MNNRKRQSNFELLRIVSMLMIVAYHLYIHGVYRIGVVSFDTHTWFLENTVNKFFSLLFIPGGEIGVGIFFMLTGYFLCEKDSVHFSRVVIRAVFYSLISILISVAIIMYRGGAAPTSDFIGNLLRYVFFPVFEGNWWFASAYLFLLMLVPFLNVFLRGENRLIIVFICYLYVASVLIGAPHFDVIKAVFFYTMGALFKSRRLKHNSKQIFLFVFLFFVIWLFIVFLNVGLLLHHNKMMQKLLPFAISAFLVPAGVWLLFQIFSSMDIGYNEAVNKIASTTFGVYLLHDSKVVRHILWNPILKIADWQIYQSFFPIIALFEVFALFMICSIVDFMYQRVFEKRISGKFNKLLKF